MHSHLPLHSLAQNISKKEKNNSHRRKQTKAVFINQNALNGLSSSGTKGRRERREGKGREREREESEENRLDSEKFNEFWNKDYKPARAGLVTSDERQAGNSAGLTIRNKTWEKREGSGRAEKLEGTAPSLASEKLIQPKRTAAAVVGTSHAQGGGCTDAEIPHIDTRQEGREDGRRGHFAAAPAEPEPSAR